MKKLELLPLPDYDPKDQAGECVFDPDAAIRPIQFFENFLQHDIGKWAGDPFILSDWQQSVVGNLFGWLRPDRTRRFRSGLIELPRKCGKSHLAAGLALYCLIADNENGASVVAAASTRDQASIVFGIAKRFVERDETLSKHCKIYRNAITVESTGSSMKAISSDSGTAHGLNLSACIMDELHVWTKPDARELYEALVTSQGARNQPINIAITTAGTAEPTLWRDVHNFARGIQSGDVVDSSFLPAIWAAGKDDAWDDPEVWRRVNPALGVTVQEEFYEQECAKAKALPSYANAFRRLYLNQPTESLDRWLSMEHYDECEERMSFDELQGRVCYAGLDLSSTLDLTALVLVFPRTDEEGKGYDVVPFFFVPADNIHKRSRDDHVPYNIWRDEGDEHGKFLIATEGDVIDYAYIRKKINELGKIYNIKEISIDRWNATALSVELQQDGFNVAFCGQGFRSLSAPSKELEANIIGKRFRHGKHPVLRWNASVCSHEQDAAGNVKPSKKRSNEKIDGIAAAVNAIGRASAAGDDNEGSIYEERGLETF